MNSVKHKYYKNQEFCEWHQTEFMPTCEHALGTVMAFDAAATELVNKFAYLEYKYGIVFPSHDELARQIGWSRETVKRRIDDLKSLNCLRVFGRKNNTNIYKLSAWFYKTNVYKELSKKFRFFHLAINRLLSRKSKVELVSYNDLRNLITKASKAILTNTTKHKEEEKNFQRQNLNRKVSMYEYEIRDSIKKLRIKFTQEQQEFLMHYTDAQLLAAEKKVLARKEVKNPPILFLWLMHNDDQIKNMSETNQNTTEEKKEAPKLIASYEQFERDYVDTKLGLWPMVPPEPWIEYSETDNIARFEIWAYRYSDNFIAFTKLPLIHYKESFLRKVESLFKNPEAIERWKQAGKERRTVEMKNNPGLTWLDHTQPQLLETSQIHQAIYEYENFVEQLGNLPQEIKSQGRILLPTAIEILNNLKNELIRRSSQMDIMSIFETAAKEIAQAEIQAKNEEKEKEA